MVRRLALIFLAATLAGCTAGSPSSSTTSPSRTSPSASSSTSAAPTPTPTNQPSPDIVARVPIPGAVIAAFGSLWVQERQDGSVWRLDPSGTVVARIPHAVRAIEHFGTDTFVLGAGFGSIWGLTDGAVVRIDPETNERVATIAVPEHAFGLAVGPEGVWVSCCSNGLPSLIQIDPDTNTARVVEEMQISPSSLAVGNGYVWWGNFSEGGAMQRIDPATGHQVRIEAANMRFIVPTPKWTWLIAADGATQRVAATSVAAADDAGRKAPVAIGAVYSHGAVWINAGDAIRFDADTGQIGTRIRLAKARYQASGGIAVLGKRVWVAQPAHDRVIGAPIT